MSDNPADSLRRELEAAIDGARLHVFWPASMPKAAVDAIWPLISAALEAARAEGTDETVEILLPLVGYLCDNHADRYGGNHCIDVALDLLRESDSRVEAARADERERLIFALGSLDGKDFMDAPIHHRAEEAHAWAAGHDAGVEAAAELARGGV